MRKWGESGLRHLIAWDSDAFAWVVALAAVGVALVVIALEGGQ
jgi:hypothetical protein